MADGAATTQPTKDNGLATTSRPAEAAALPGTQHHDVRRDEQIQSKLFGACSLKKEEARRVVTSTFMEIGRANKDWEKAWNEIDRHALAISEKHNVDFRDFVENHLKLSPEELDKAVQRGIANNTMRPMRPEAQAIPLPSPREVSSYYGKRVPEEPHRPDEDPVSFSDNIKRTQRVAAGLLAAGGTKIEHQAAVDAYNYGGVNSPATFQKGGAPQGAVQQFAPGPSAQGSGLTWDPATGRPVPAGYAAAPEQAPVQQAGGPVFTNQEAVRNSVETTDAGYHQARQGLRLNNAADVSNYAHKNRALNYQRREVHSWIGYFQRVGRIGR